MPNWGRGLISQLVDIQFWILIFWSTYHLYDTNEPANYFCWFSISYKIGNHFSDWSKVCRTKIWNKNIWDNQLLRLFESIIMLSNFFSEDSVEDERLQIGLQHKRIFIVQQNNYIILQLLAIIYDHLQLLPLNRILIQPQRAGYR